MPYFRNFKCGVVAGIGWKSADLWPGGPLSTKVFPKFFYLERTKIHDFISKKHTPRQKGPFFLEGGG